MRPIKLTIKGLNSFIEEQTIDFDQLTQQGLFGIFGPTGSGKSTILDGMTLALYGDISRKSSNYINTNCNELNVSYEFQVSGTVQHTYKVTRQFRRDKKTGNAKTHAASIITYTPEGPKVLGEGATQVTKVCKEILGLSLDDFTRTVVLPQGKFSEFLKLEGKNRREMLERLFNLQEYGESLSQKLSKAINIEEAHYQRLSGELKGYEEVSKERLEEAKEALEESKKQFEHLQVEQSKVEAEFKESEEVWTLQQEIKACMMRQKELEKQQPLIQEKQVKAQKGESALKVYPNLLNYEKTQELLQIEEKRVVELKQQELQLGRSKQALEESFQIATKEREEKLPELREKRQSLCEVLEDQAAAIKIEESLIENQKGLKEVADKISGLSTQKVIVDQALAAYQQALTDLQQQEQEQKVEETIRRRVQDGLMKEQHYKIEAGNLQQNEVYLAKLEADKKQLEEEKQAIAQQVKTVNERLLTKKEQQAHLQLAPVSQEELMMQQQEVASLRVKWMRYEVVQQEMQDNKMQQVALSEEEEKSAKSYGEQKQKVEAAQIALEEARMENLAHLLQQHLHTGDHCPVCGGMIDQLPMIKEEQQEWLQQQEVRLSEEQAQLAREEKGLNQIKLKQAALQENREKLSLEEEPLRQLFSKTSVKEVEEELTAKTSKMKHYQEQKQQIEEELTAIREEKNGLEQKLGQKEAAHSNIVKQQQHLNQEIVEKRKALKLLQDQMSEIKEQLNGVDFEIVAKEIQEKDKKREGLTAQLQQLTKEKEEKQQMREELQSRISKWRASFQRGLVQFDEKQKNKRTLLQRIGNRLSVSLDLITTDDTLEQVKMKIWEVIERNALLKGQLKEEMPYHSVLVDYNEEEESEVEVTTLLVQYPLIGEGLSQLQHQIAEMVKQMGNRMETIEKTYASEGQALREITEQYEEVAKQLLEAQTNYAALNKRLSDEAILVRERLEEEQLTAEEVKCYLLSREEIEALKAVINAYKEECSKLAGAMENAQHKKGDRVIEEVQWQHIEQRLRQVTEATSKQHEKTIMLENAATHMEKALEKLGELLQEKEKLEHRQAMLSDLSSLFKGKRFVQYVAVARLKYIAMAASKRLKEITSGNYGMEADEEGRFIIRDYKNGGAERDASTLSGGETFLASLALALALSAQIQLKGTAPLELFFLDEGFGTLDDDLLEVVMNSLERLHHDKLKVGIISHVESIKNRMPMKLILTPAEAGMGGTKVRMERG